jgi:polyhydroxybutyrate depolymerase
MRNVILFFIILLCYKSNAQIKYGKNLVNTMSEGVEREYVVHVPLTYDDTKEVPLVFMLHGTSGSGPDFYENIGWKELSETENFIVVYPSSLRYKIVDEEGPKVTTKWNTPPDANFALQPGEVGKDDIKFLRKVIDEVSAKYKIDATRIYLSGFSNGGQMAAKCAIEMGDVLAAVCQNASSYTLDTNYILKRKLPILYQVGDKDYGPGNEGPAVPMHLFDTLISTPGLPYKNGKFYEVANLTQRHFDLLSEHTIEGDSNLALVATFLPKPNTGGYEYKYILVKNLAHNYPNGVFHDFDAPKIHWNWMKQYTLPDTTVNNDGKKIKVVTNVENVNREYFIHLPEIYDGTKPTPVVMMFHGGGHDGELFYNISGWNEVADTANIIMVYPSSLKYCIIEDGDEKVISQWNNGHSGNTFCPNQTLKDDVLFVNTILQEISVSYNIDARRIYTVGFSNGGEFAATRTAIELSDKIAASISCGGGGALPRDTILLPKRKLPVMLMFGNKDERMLAAVNAIGSVPMGFEILYNQYPVLYFAQVKPYIHSFDLDEQNYKIIGDTNSVTASIFKGKTNNPLNIFWNVEVKNLKHEYPNGINHPLHGAVYHWKWFNQFSLPQSSGTENEQHPTGHNLVFYPNPSADKIYFEKSLPYSVYNMQGELLKTGHDSEVIINDMRSGMYIIKSGNQVAKLLVSR